MNIADLLADAEEASVPDRTSLEWLVRHGVPTSALTFPFEPFSIRVSRVIHEDGRYRPSLVGRFAFVLPEVVDDEIVDLVAWSPATKSDPSAISSRLGVAAMLGEELIGLEGRGTTGLPLRVFPEPIGYLQAGWHGLVIVDWEQAAHLLAGISIRAETVQLDAQLRRRLIVPAPAIISRPSGTRDAA